MSKHDKRQAQFGRALAGPMAPEVWRVSILPSTSQFEAELLNYIEHRITWRQPFIQFSADGPLRPMFEAMAEFETHMELFITTTASIGPEIDRRGPQFEWSQR